MIKPLKRFYKHSEDSGKLELFGIDGLEHAVISAFVMVVVPVITFFAFSKEWIQTATIITFVVLTMVWFFIEQSQERKMYKKSYDKVFKRYTRPKNFWRFWQWSKARLVDMFYRLPFDCLVLLVVIFKF